MRINGRIPIFIEPLFLVIAALIGYLSAHSLLGALTWFFVIVVSIFVHEMGHAVVCYLMGLNPCIRLTTFGGVTDHLKASSRLKEALIIISGPFFGFLLYLVSSFLQPFFWQNQAVFNMLWVFSVVNFFWTFINLMPVIPLDGGQLMRLALEALFKKKGSFYAFLVSAIVGLFLGLFFLFQGAYFLGLLFLYGFYLSYQEQKY